MRANALISNVPGETKKIINGIEYVQGDKVRLSLGKKRADAADFLLDEKIATIEKIYTDYNDEIHFAVTLDDDPGQDLQREMGIYHYFSLEEIEPYKS